MNRKTEFEIVTAAGGKAFADAGYHEPRYWYRLGKYDMWQHDATFHQTPLPCWVVAERVGADQWQNHCRFETILQAVDAVKSGDFSACTPQQGHVKHPKIVRKILVNIRLTEAEYYQLKKTASPKTMSEYIRELALKQ
jgi:hypothetical protein